jgi:hypothetical protein
MSGLSVTNSIFFTPPFGIGPSLTTWSSVSSSAMLGRSMKFASSASTAA